MAVGCMEETRNEYKNVVGISEEKKALTQK
jgi:hypothetical protein